MSAPDRVTLPTRSASPIPFGVSVATWAIAWVAGSLLLAPLVVIVLGGDFSGDLSIPLLSAATAATWAAFLAALAFASRRFGTGDFVADYAVGFKPIDLVGVPVGVVLQLFVIPLLYLPLASWWPGTFNDEAIEERARDLVDRADGAGIFLLVLVVAVGAPIVEELVYRGLVQRSLANLTNAWPALVMASIWFALVHPSPVEYPGLLLAGLTFGAGLVLTGRLGAPMITHAAFNATGLVVALQAGS